MVSDWTSRRSAVLLLGQQASCAQPLVLTLQMVLLANSAHDGSVEFVPPSGPHSHRIELTCYLDVGVVAQELVDQFDNGRRGLVELPCLLGQLQMQGVRRAAVEADLRGDVGSLEHGHVGDEKACHALALAVRRAGIVP